MPKFQYVSDEVRDYVDFGRIENGATVTAAEAPDFRWQSASQSAQTVQSEQTPSTSSTDTSTTPA
jgi:hypothetical protein